MSEPAPAHRITEVHLEGWTVVRLRGALAGPAVEPVTTRVASLLQDGDAVALDLGHEPVDDTGLAAVIALAGAGAQLVVVVSDEDSRERMRGAGATAVHESLDAALEVTAAPLREAGPGSAARLTPAAGDALIVTTRNISGTSGST